MILQMGAPDPLAGFRDAEPRRDTVDEAEHLLGAESDRQSRAVLNTLVGIAEILANGPLERGLALAVAQPRPVEWASEVIPAATPAAPRLGARFLVDPDLEKRVPAEPFGLELGLEPPPDFRERDGPPTIGIRSTFRLDSMTRIFLSGVATPVSPFGRRSPAE